MSDVLEYVGLVADADRLNRLEVKNVDVQAGDLDYDLLADIIDWHAVAMPAVSDEPNAVSLVCNQLLPLAELKPHVGQGFHAADILGNEVVTTDDNEPSAPEEHAVDFGKALTDQIVKGLNVWCQGWLVKAYLCDDPMFYIVCCGFDAILVFGRWGWQAIDSMS